MWQEGCWSFQQSPWARECEIIFRGMLLFALEDVCISQKSSS